jgi:hypothetical protein
LTMAAPRRFTPAQVVAAVRRAHGLLVAAAGQLGCDAETIYNYKKRYPVVAAAIQDARARTTDLAELKLYEAIHRGEGWAIMFYLRTQGKSRGYVERRELTGGDGAAVEIQLTWGDGTPVGDE